MNLYFRILILLHSNYYFSQLQGQTKIDPLINELSKSIEETNKFNYHNNQQTIVNKVVGIMI
jgi:hypothetical protein